MSCRDRERVRSVFDLDDPAYGIFVAAFFDRWLRGRDGHVLDGPSPRFPDITFIS